MTSGPSCRDAAIHQLADALDRTACLGITTNRAFLARVLRHPAFAGDGVTTAFLGLHFANDAARAGDAPSWLRALAAASHALLPPAALPPLWAGWTSSDRVDTAAPIELDGRPETWRLTGTPSALVARCGHTTHAVAVLHRDSRSTITALVDGRPLTARCVSEGHDSWWLCDGAEATLRDLRLSGTQGAQATAPGALRAPMHGRITHVHATAGATVQAGALLLVMEAMKMEHQIVAPFAGTVSALHTRVDDQVGARQVLIEIAP